MEYFKNYFKELNDRLCDIDMGLFKSTVSEIEVARDNGNKMIVVGNGGSAAIATHVAVDFSKCKVISSMSFNEAGLITCYANDYGYGNWVARAFDTYGKKGDIAVLISSSGRSDNILNAAKRAMELGMKVITLSGFDKDNPLRNMGIINFWVNSHKYNIVEMTHNVWLCSIIDFMSK